MTANQLTVFPPEPTLTASFSADQPALLNGWRWVKLGDVCERIVGGGTPSTKNADYWNGDIDWITSADIYGIKDIRPRKKISEKAIENSTTNLLPAGGIIVVTRVGLGKLAVVPHRVCFSQDSQGLVLNKDLITTEYALWCLSEAVQIFKYENRGTTISGVTKKQLVDLKIALPPLAEQQRIVAKVEELFSEIDAGVKEVETALQRLKTYRQAVLHYFLSNDKWERVKLGEVSSVTGGVTKNSKREALPIQVPYLRVANVYADRLDLTEIKEIGVLESEIERSVLKSGDLLVVEGNGSIEQVGRVALWQGEIPYCLHQNHLIKIRFENLAISAFLLKWLLSPLGRGAIERQASSTSGLHTLSISKIAGLVIPFPDLDTQTRVVQEIEARLSQADALEKTLRTELQRAERLRQSVLKQAFTGELLKTDVPASLPV